MSTVSVQRPRKRIPAATRCQSGLHEVLFATFLDDATVGVWVRQVESVIARGFFSDFDINGKWESKALETI